MSGVRSYAWHNVFLSLVIVVAITATVSLAGCSRTHLVRGSAADYLPTSSDMPEEYELKDETSDSTDSKDSLLREWDFQKGAESFCERRFFNSSPSTYPRSSMIAVFKGFVLKTEEDAKDWFGACVSSTEIFRDTKADSESTAENEDVDEYRVFHRSIGMPLFLNSDIGCYRCGNFVGIVEVTYHFSTAAPKLGPASYISLIACKLGRSDKKVNLRNLIVVEGRYRGKAINYIPSETDLGSGYELDQETSSKDGGARKVFDNPTNIDTGKGVATLTLNVSLEPDEAVARGKQDIMSDEKKVNEYFSGRKDKAAVTFTRIAMDDGIDGIEQLCAYEAHGLTDMEGLRTGFIYFRSSNLLGSAIISVFGSESELSSALNEIMFLWGKRLKNTSGGR